MDQSLADNIPAWEGSRHDAMNSIVGASITYRLAFGPNAGRKALTLQTVPAKDRQSKPNELVSRQAGFSLHAGVACKSTQRKKLERLCRYIARPAIAEQRLSIASNGNVIVGLKTPYDDGTTHVILSPLEFIGRLAALVRSRPHPDPGSISGDFMACSRGAAFRPTVSFGNTSFPENRSSQKNGRNPKPTR